MDRSVDPCDDFFEFACGGWKRKHVIPDDKSYYDVFEELNEELQINLKGEFDLDTSMTSLHHWLQFLLAALLDTPQTASDNEATRKVKSLYQACVNTCA